MTPESPEAAALIKLLVARHVAITSTLPVFEANLAGKPVLRPKALATLTPQALEAYLYARNRRSTSPDTPALPWNEQLQKRRATRTQVCRSRRLSDGGPRSYRQRGYASRIWRPAEVELLVTDAGFTPAEAIKIATLNGAIYLGQQDHIGSVEAGKDADLMIVKGDPSANITDIENVEIVLKDGAAYDSNKLLESVKGRYGEY